MKFIIKNQTYENFSPFFTVLRENFRSRNQNGNEKTPHKVIYN